MSSINRVILVGRTGGEPEVRQLDGGVSVATISLATSEKFKDKSGNQQEKTEWHRVTFWRGLAEVVEKYVKKGDLIYIEGKIQSREYEKDGVKMRATDIVASEMKMLGGKGGNDSDKPAYGGPAKSSGQSAKYTSDEDDDNSLPF